MKFLISAQQVLIRNFINIYRSSSRHWIEEEAFESIQHSHVLAENVFQECHRKDNTTNAEESKEV
jgi:hypothetical protein